MKIAGKAVLNLILVFLSLLFCGFSVYHAGEADNIRKTALISLAENPVPLSEALEVQKSEEEEDISYSFVYWDQKDKQQAENENLNRTAQVTAVYLCGDSNILFLRSPGLYTEDSAGCLIDEDTSYALYGDKNGVGNQLQFGGRELTVRGILKEASGTIVVQADKETGFTMLSARVPDGQRKSELISGLSGRYGYPEQEVAVGFFALAAKTSALLLLFGVFFVLAKRMVKQGLEFRSRPLVLLFYAGMIVLLVLVLRWLSPFSLFVWEEVLPNQWSDFSYYPQFYHQRAQAVFRLFMMEKGTPFLYTLEVTGAAVKYGIAALICFLLYNRRAEAADTGQLFSQAALMLVLSFMVFIILNRQNAVSSSRMMIWLLYPVFVAGIRLTNFWKQHLYRDQELLQEES